MASRSFEHSKGAENLGGLKQIILRLGNSFNSHHFVTPRRTRKVQYVVMFSTFGTPGSMWHMHPLNVVIVWNPEHPYVRVHAPWQASSPGVSTVSSPCQRNTHPTNLSAGSFLFHFEISRQNTWALLPPGCVIRMEEPLNRGQTGTLYSLGNNYSLALRKNYLLTLKIQSFRLVPQPAHVGPRSLYV